MAGARQTKGLIHKSETVAAVEKSLCDSDRRWTITNNLTTISATILSPASETIRNFCASGPIWYLAIIFYKQSLYKSYLYSGSILSELSDSTPSNIYQSNHKSVSSSCQQSRRCLMILPFPFDCDVLNLGFKTQPNDQILSITLVDLCNSELSQIVIVK